jgi:catechol 2,3-dioxygenase-like lactoylglutathione lyase family enzyme
MKINRIDHIGINVEDFEAAKEFFIDLGFEVTGEMDMEGELVEKVIGLSNVKDRFAMLKTPGGEACIELIKFYQPLDEKGIQPSSANTLGMRHICLNVDDVDGIVAKLDKKGFKLAGEMQNYQNVYKLCYVRGPEGIILELAEELK